MLSNNPYPGLRPFERDETDIFFGRESQIDHLVDDLEQSRFLSVVGPSGSGKSSLVRAGLLDALESGFMASAGAGWQVAEMRPGNQPLLRLADALLNLSGQKRQTRDHDLLKAALEAGRDGLLEHVKSAPWLPKGDNLLILVDQFEELFRFDVGQSNEEAEAFVRLLLGAVKQKDQPIYVVITMRSDFIGDCAQFMGLPEAVNDNQFLTPRLTREQSQMAIEEPARVFGGSLEPALVNRLLNAMGNDPDQLPLMQHALMRLWTFAKDKAPDRIYLTLKDYESIGELKDALSQHANEAYEELSPAQQKIAQVLFRTLTQRGENKRDTRRPTSFGELVKRVTGDSFQKAEQEQVLEVLDVFRTMERSFLVPVKGVPLKANTVVDISHESLIRQWDQLKSWVTDEVQSAETYTRLERDAKDWKEKGTALRVPPRLDFDLQWKVEENPTAFWASRYGGDFEVAMEFLATSKTEHDAAVEANKKKQEQELAQARTFAAEQAKLAEAEKERAEAEKEKAVEQEKRAEAEKERAAEQEKRAEAEQQGAQRFKRLTAVLALLVVLAVVAGVVAWNQTQVAERERQAAQEAEAQAIVAQSEAEASLIEAEKAKAETEKALTQAQEAEERATQEANRAEESEERRTTELFDSQLTHASLLARGDDYAAAKVVLSKTTELDSQISLSRRHARDFLTRYSDIMGGHAQQIYQGAGAALISVSVSPDGQWLVAVGENGTVVIFDVESGDIRQRLQGHEEDVHDVVFHPEGKWVYTRGDDGQIIRWSLPSKEMDSVQLASWEISAQVWALALSPDGKILASGGNDGKITLWEAESDKKIRELLGHRSAIAARGLAFDPSGKKIASASYDDTAKIWDVETGKMLVTLRGHAGNVQNAVFSSNAEQIATSSDDRRVVLWDVNSGQPQKILSGHQNFGTGLAYLAPKKDTLSEEELPLLISASMDRTLRVWDTDSGITQRLLQGHEAGVLGIHVHTSQEGKTQLFSASNDGTIRRWDLSMLPDQYLLDIPKEASAISIAPNGQQVVVSFADGTLRLYSIPEGKLLAEKMEAHENDIVDLRFNKGGKTLATASFDDTAKIWSVGTNGELNLKQTFEGHHDGIRGVALSEDGRTLATGSDDGQVGLFSIGSDEKRFFHPFDGNDVNAVVFSKGKSHLLASGRFESSLWDWSHDPPELQRTFPKSLHASMGANLSPDGRLMARYGRGASKVEVYSTQDGTLQHRLVGHEQTVYAAHFSPDGRQLASVSIDATVRLWDLETSSELFTLRLPTNVHPPSPLWDFDFRCTPTGCWIAVPLTRGKLALHNLGMYAKE